MLKINNVYNMDCMEGIKLLDDKSIDLVIIDPPYKLNLSKLKHPSSFNSYANELLDLKDGFDLKVLDLLVQKMKKINIYIYCSKRQVKELLEYFMNKDCNYEILTWHKMNPSPLTNNNYLPDTEYVVFAREKGVRLYGNYHTKRKYYISGVNQVDKKKWKHPTIKPLPFIENHIINSSNEGDLILDCFAGSGTTSLAAMKLGRNSIGYEINNEFFPIIKEKFSSVENSNHIVEYMRDDNPDYNISSLPYLFKDPHKMDKKVDVKKLQFGSRLDAGETKKEEMFSVKEVVSPNTLILNNGLTIKLLGVEPNKEHYNEAIEFLKQKLKKRKVFLKYDTIKYDSSNLLLCYLYLDNKTFINRHLVKTGFVSVDTAIDYKYKKKFLEDVKNG